jgi:hypothetical protein
MSDLARADDREALRRAAELHRPLSRAAAVARVNGLSLAIFGGLTLVVSVVGLDPVGLMLGAVVLWVGLAERRGAKRLLAAERRAARELARNELVLLAAIVVYGILMLTVLRPDVAEWQAALEGVLPKAEAQQLIEASVTATYGMVLVVALAYQGSLARYFWNKEPELERYLAEVPPWAREVLGDLKHD